MERRGVITPGVFGRGAGGGEEFRPTRVGDVGECACGEVYLGNMIGGGEVVIGEKAVSWGSCGALALMGIVVIGSSSSSSSGSGSSLGEVASFGGELGFDLGLSVFFFFPNPKKERLLP